MTHRAYTKAVRLTIVVDRKDLRDFAAAFPSDDLRDIFFVPAYLKAGPKARGPFAKGARVVPLLSAVARRLRLELQTDRELLRRVKTQAQRSESGVRPDDPRDLVAYMLDEVWCEVFGRLHLRRPLDDIEAFAKQYLRRGHSVDVEAAERNPRFFNIVDRTILRFDPTYLHRQLHQIGTLPESPGINVAR